MLDLNSLKQCLGLWYAKSFLKSTKLKLGVGTGTTVVQCLEHLAKIHKEDPSSSLRIVCSSLDTQYRCQELNLPLVLFEQIESLDLYIDGADQIDPEGNMLKGNGGAAFKERVLMSMATKVDILADHSKLVKNLELQHTIHLECLPWALPLIRKELRFCNALFKIYSVPVNTFGKLGPTISDNGGVLGHLEFQEKPLASLTQLYQKLSCIPGVLACGLFPRTLIEGTLHFHIINPEGVCHSFSPNTERIHL